jgi:hypothetical protein
MSCIAEATASTFERGRAEPVCFACIDGEDVRGVVSGTTVENPSAETDEDAHILT